MLSSIDRATLTDSKLLSRYIGQKITQMCYMAVSISIDCTEVSANSICVQGTMTPSGLVPERTDFHHLGDENLYNNVTVQVGTGEPTTFVIKEQLSGKPMGGNAGLTEYKGRPETIESVFYM